jgi:hypothetical protein
MRPSANPLPITANDMMVVIFQDLVRSFNAQGEFILLWMYRARSDTMTGITVRSDFLAQVLATAQHPESCPTCQRHWPTPALDVSSAFISSRAKAHV